MNLLHIDSSALGDNSASRRLSAAVVARLQQRHPELQLRYRDLDREPIAHLSSAALGGQDAVAAAQGQQALDEFLAADVIVIGAPMYNFGIPSTLKAWIDRIAIAGKTFRYTAEGPQGLAGDKRVVLALARGGVYAPAALGEHQESYLRFMFGFLGIQAQVLTAEGLAYDGADRDAIVAQALADFELPQLAAAA
ncbi:MAG: NAD(P)H-dependent oxidoreductase [Lysobacterales bacterium]